MFERGERPTGPGEEITEWRDRDGYLIRETRTEAPDGKVTTTREVVVDEGVEGVEKGPTAH
jgi:hypothetical protein